MDNKRKVLEKLKKVLDPELNISIVDLGLVYDVRADGKNIEVIYTLTTPGCPMSEVIEMLIKEQVPGARVTLTFDPPWSPDRMSDSAKARLGMV